MRAFVSRRLVSVLSSLVAALVLAAPAFAFPAQEFRLVIEVDPADRPPTVSDQASFRITSPDHEGVQAYWAPKHPARALVTESMVAGLGSGHVPSPHEYEDARYAFIVETRDGGVTLTGLRGVRWMELSYDVRGDAPCRAEVTSAGVRGLSDPAPR